MSTEKPTPQEVQSWIVTNVRRIKQVRMLTVKDIARRMDIQPETVLELFGRRSRENKVMTLTTLVRLANALEMTPAELVSRPDDMTVVDHRQFTHLHRRKKAKLKLTEEEQERQALLESLGLDD